VKKIGQFARKATGHKKNPRILENPGGSWVIKPFGAHQEADFLTIHRRTLEIKYGSSIEFPHEKCYPNTDGGGIAES
jgi:hypothetical protein